MRRSLKRVISLLLFAGLLTGCMADVPGAFVDRELASAAPEKSGLLVGSISRPNEERTYSKYTLKFRRVGTDKKMVAHYSRMIPASSDFADERTAGTVFVMNLPEGEYEIYNFELYAGSTTSARQDFSVRFRVQPGKTNYLGEFLGKTVFAPDILLGRPAPAGVRWVLSDRGSRDLAVARKATVDPRLEAVAPIVIDIDLGTNPFFVDGRVPETKT
jgi:hypothetical protein